MVTLRMTDEDPRAYTAMRLVTTSEAELTPADPVERALDRAEQDYIQNEMPVRNNRPGSSRDPAPVVIDAADDEQAAPVAEQPNVKKGKAKKQKAKKEILTVDAKAVMKGDLRRAQASTWGRCYVRRCGCAYKPVFVAKTNTWMKACPARKKGKSLMHGIYRMTHEDVAKLRPYDKRRARKARQQWELEDAARRRRPV